MMILPSSDFVFKETINLREHHGLPSIRTQNQLRQNFLVGLSIWFIFYLELFSNTCLGLPTPNGTSPDCFTTLIILPNQHRSLWLDMRNVRVQHNQRDQVGQSDLHKKNFNNFPSIVNLNVFRKFSILSWI